MTGEGELERTGQIPRLTGESGTSRPSQRPRSDKFPGSPGNLAALEGRYDEPLLKIVKGDPSPEEVAALVAVVAALGAGVAGAGEPAPSVRPEWNAPHRLVRGAHAPGAGGWRTSGLPR
ncbi:MAG: acyl-CoA carboxylase epsilon subunit [Nocardioides sp.]